MFTTDKDFAEQQFGKFAPVYLKWNTLKVSSSSMYTMRLGKQLMCNTYPYPSNKWELAIADLQRMMAFCQKHNFNLEFSVYENKEAEYFSLTYTIT